MAWVNQPFYHAQPPFIHDIMNEKKKRLRKEILERRDSIPSEVRKEKDRAIQERFAGLEAYRNAKAVMLFAPFRSEVDTTGIIIDALKSDKKVILPKVDTAEKRLRLYVIKGMEELKPGCMGIPEPDVSSEREVTAEDADFIMMPGVAFDERCGGSVMAAHTTTASLEA